MLRIAGLLTSDHILADLEVGSKKRFFEYVAVKLEKLHGIPVGVTLDALATREKLGSTALGLGVAIPHGRVKGLKEVVVTFARLAAAIDFDAPDGKPVQLVFALLVPEAANETHLQLIAELAQMFSKHAFREKLSAAPDSKAILEAFTSWTGM